jgi:hypothetical protein
MKKFLIALLFLTGCKEVPGIGECYADYKPDSTLVLKVTELERFGFWFSAFIKRAVDDSRTVAIGYYDYKMFRETGLNRIDCSAYEKNIKDYEQSMSKK